MTQGMPKRDRQVQEKQIPDKSLHLGAKKLKKGLKIWELNLAKLEVYEAKIEETEVVMFGGKAVPKRKLVMQKNCIYVDALNLENAKRKFKAQLKKRRQTT